MLFLSEKLRDPRIPGKILFNEDENAHLPLHWHTNVEICYFLQGGFRARVDNKCYDVQNQQLILVNSGQLHHVGENSVGEHRGISLFVSAQVRRAQLFFSKIADYLLNALIFSTNSGASICPNAS